MAAVVAAQAQTASAYTVRETAAGTPVRWTSSTVAIELDPSLLEGLPYAMAAAQTAAAAWNERAVGPTLEFSPATSRSTPAVDGRNVVYFLPGYPAAAGALAITLVSYDDVTGAIVDTDVVINGEYPFALLPDDARAPSGVLPVANEPVADDVSTGGLWRLSESSSGLSFDLVHVLVHESGHVLGLRDESSTSADVMFLFSVPGDATGRTPTDDDAGGVAFLYADSASSGQGCSFATPPDVGGARMVWAVVGCAGFAALLRRRRVRGQAPEARRA
jgi:hypothetical protein